MRKLLALGLVISGMTLLAAFGGCSSDPTSDEQDQTSCSGAKLDSAGKCRRADGRFASAGCCAAKPKELFCDVVDQSGGELEEGFGSYYAIDEDGFSDADEDAEDIDFTPEDWSLSLGHHSFEKADGDEIVFTAATEKRPYDQFLLTPSESSERYEIRVFENRLGVVLYEPEKGDGAEHIGTLDCRDVLDAEPAVSDVTKMDSCDVVWVNTEINDHLFEEGFGSIYDIDEDTGVLLVDGDSLAVDFDGAEGARELGIGQMSYAQADGDAISVDVNDERIEYVVRPKDSEDVFTVRVFTAANDAEIPGIGVVLYQPSADEAPDQYAVIDCRGIESPHDDL